MWRKIIKEETNAGKFMRCEKFFPLQLAARRHSILMAPSVQPLNGVFTYFSVFSFFFFGGPANKFFSAPLCLLFSTFPLLRGKMRRNEAYDKQIFLKHKSVR